MGYLLKEQVVITKVFNNNVILVRDNGTEKIIVKIGIGFGKKFGQTIEAGIEVDKIFSIESEENKNNLKEVIHRVDSKFFALCEEVIVQISKELGEELNENIHISLVDHLSFAIKRLKKNEVTDNPFLVEIKTLYKKEYKLAQNVSKKISEEVGVDIPDGEVGLIALHIHSARNEGNLSNTIKYGYLSNKIIEDVESKLNKEISRDSLDYARFITHIRFAIERIITNSQLTNELAGAIEKQYPLSYSIAIDASKIIEKELGIEMINDEVAYLAMHIERFKVTMKL